MKGSISAAAILYQLEHPETIDGTKPAKPTRSSLIRSEDRAYDTWKLPDPIKSATSQSNSSPSKLAPSKSMQLIRTASSMDAPSSEGVFAGYAGEESGKRLSPTSSQFPKGIDIELHRRGFTIADRPPIESFLGVNNKFPGNGPGKYDTHEIGCMVWDKNGDVSNPAQKQLSQHKTPKRVFFSKSAAPAGARKHLLSQAPGPGHYAKPDLWDPNLQCYPTKGTSFVRKAPRAGESRFGGLARGLVKGGKGDMDLLGS